MPGIPALGKLSWLLFCHCDRTPWPRQLRGETVYFGSQATAEGKSQQQELRQLVMLRYSRQTVMSACTQLTPFLQPRIPAKGVVPPTVGWAALPTSANLIKITASMVARVHFAGDARPRIGVGTDHLRGWGRKTWVPGQCGILVRA